MRRVYDDGPEAHVLGGRSREERERQRREDAAEREKPVCCKGLHYLHQTAKGGLLVQEGEDLAGITWKIDGKQTWLSKQFLRSVPSFNTQLQRYQKIDELWLPKWLAVEKEMMYE